MTNSTVARLPKGCWSLEPAYRGDSGQQSLSEVSRRGATCCYGKQGFCSGAQQADAGREKTAGVAPGEIRITLNIAELFRDGSAIAEGIMTQYALRIRRFLVSEDGPTAVEYAVMLALIVVVCLVAIGQIGTNANATFTSVANSLGGGS
jgi:pilus assembly protein Flp/PilA